MAEASPTLDRTTTKIRATIFGGLRSIGQVNVARAIGVSEATLSEWLPKHGDRMAQVLAACGLKVVPAEHQCFAPEYVDRLRYFAEIGIRQQPEPLDWQDE